MQRQLPSSRARRASRLDGCKARGCERTAIEGSVDPHCGYPPSDRRRCRRFDGFGAASLMLGAKTSHGTTRGARTSRHGKHQRWFRVRAMRAAALRVVFIMRRSTRRRTTTETASAPAPRRRASSSTGGATHQQPCFSVATTTQPAETPPRPQHGSRRSGLLC